MTWKLPVLFASSRRFVATVLAQIDDSRVLNLDMKTPGSSELRLGRPFFGLRI